MRLAFVAEERGVVGWRSLNQRKHRPGRRMQIAAVVERPSCQRMVQAGVREF